jgi:uncharacterized membrane protein YgcG
VPMRDSVAGIETLRRSFTLRRLLPFVLGLTAAALAASPASAEMQSVKLDRHVCETTGGGRFVPIPDFPGEEIDRRLLPDIAWMERRFDIFITDGYSTDPVHARDGEHPIGLATDIVPNEAEGGTWTKIGRLANLAEPKQNEPILPWRWVGWNGDPGHGRGDHLHLSWDHSPSEPRHPARVVYTRICPEPADPGTPSGGGSGRHHHGGRRRATGGTRPSGRGGGSSSGGITPGGGSSPAKLTPNLPAPVSDY